jgi:hypothetical protein
MVDGCCCGSCCHALARRASASWHWLQTQAAEQAPVVLIFLDGTLIYAMSQQWDDLLSIYTFRLRPLPYCSFTQLDCTKDAEASSQFLYAVCLVLVASLVLCVAAHFQRVIRSLDMVPKIAGMCIGWALGHACQQSIIQIDNRARAANTYCVGPRPF